MLKKLLCGRLAQLVEHCDHTAGVTGSSPVAPIAPQELSLPPSFSTLSNISKYIVPIVFPERKFMIFLYCQAAGLISKLARRQNNVRNDSWTIEGFELW